MQIIFQEICNLVIKSKTLGVLMTLLVTATVTGSTTAETTTPPTTNGISTTLLNHNLGVTNLGHMGNARYKYGFIFWGL